MLKRGFLGVWRVSTHESAGAGEHSLRLGWTALKGMYVYELNLKNRSSLKKSKSLKNVLRIRNFLRASFTRIVSVAVSKFWCSKTPPNASETPKFVSAPNIVTVQFIRKFFSKKCVFVKFHHLKKQIEPLFFTPDVFLTFFVVFFKKKMALIIPR